MLRGRRLTRQGLLFLALLLPLLAPTPLPAQDSHASRDWLQASAERLLAEHPDIPAVAIAVARDGQLLGTAAAGEADSGVAMTPGTPVRIASVTKTYVAATLLMLAREQALPLDTPLSALLPESFLAPLRDAGYAVDGIQLHHLLTHSAGLRDFTTDWWYRLRAVTLRYRQWTPLQQVEIAAAMGPPLGAPGERYIYSDTGYILLGQVIERLSGRSLAEAVRASLQLDALPLDATWWEQLEPAPRGAPARARQYYHGFAVDGLNPTVDLYGGGGLVASAADMAVFASALFAGQVLQPPGLLDTLLDPGGLPANSRYAYGVYVVRDGALSYYSHSGMWGTAVIFFPALNTAVAGVVTEKTAAPLLNRLLFDAAGQLRQAGQPR